MERYQRRVLSTVLTLFAVGVTALAVQWIQNRLGDRSTLTGWTLLVSTAGLLLLHFRKQIVSPKFGAVAVWLQVHMYMGSFASLVFLMHIGWPIRGAFEICLAAAFAFVSFTGVLLAVASRTMPRRLAAIAADRRVELIPVLKSDVARQAHRIAIASADLGEGATLAEYYQRRLLPFFQMPRSLLYRLLPNGIQRRRLLRELDDLRRYLADHGIESRDRLQKLVTTKDDLDFQLALQTRLRWMYALHIALIWSLAVLIAVHVALVYRFQGAM